MHGLTTNRKNVAVVLDMGVNGLGVTRSLGQNGIRVIGVDSRADVPGLTSRYCTPLLAPDVSKDPRGVLRVLLDIGESLSTRGILYPTSDAYVLFVSRFREQLSTHFLLAIPSHEVTECIVNKSRLYELAKSTGTPFPSTHFPRTIKEVGGIKDEIEYPAFIKPCYSHLWWLSFRNKGFMVYNPAQLIQKYKEIFEAQLEAIVQEVIPGPFANSVDIRAYLSMKHEPLATFVSRYVRRFPIDFGVGTCVESIHENHALEIGLKFFKEIQYVGIGEIELKKDASGTYRLLDLNARTILQSYHATCAGVNLPLIQYQDLTNQSVSRPEGYDDAVKWLDASQDFRAFYALSRTGQISFLSWLKSIQKTDCHAYFARDDLKPLVRQYLNIFLGIPRHVGTRSERSTA